MRAFEIHLNGKKLCLAGIGENGVLSAMVCLATGKGPLELHLNVGGLVSSPREHVTWIGAEPLRIGDEVQVRLVDVPSVDEPKTREQPDPERDLRAQKNYVREMAKQFRWKVQDESSDQE